jgi:hypothetical protein
MDLLRASLGFRFVVVARAPSSFSRRREQLSGFDFPISVLLPQGEKRQINFFSLLEFSASLFPLGILIHAIHFVALSVHFSPSVRSPLLLAKVVVATPFSLQECAAEHFGPRASPSARSHCRAKTPSHEHTN